ncbi:DUF2779 domain-containing protein [Aquabacterium sp.]|uniref:DUF2779 domain-containing protein n=1 Tax=Aquabacterium sp. TaxID=1872578 RepID=UPI0035B1F670
MMDAVRLLTTDDLRRWRTCPRHFWLHRRQLDEGMVSEEPSPDAQVVAGPAVLEALKASYPGAAVLPEPTTPQEWAEATQHTAALLNEGLWNLPGQAVLGACLASDDGALVRVDVLAAGALGVRLFKVKLATVGDEADVDEVALWAHVAARCGLRVQSVGMLLVDTAFVYPGLGCYAGLFREVDLAPVLGSRDVAGWLIGMRACERGEEPASDPGAHCTKTDSCAYVDHCGSLHTDRLPLRPDSLDVLGRELATELRIKGYQTIHQVPLDALPDARRRRAWRAIREGRAELEPDARTAMQALPYPRIALRIHTIGFATPIWPGTRPYHTLPYLWAADITPASGHGVQHRAFLADERGDPRRAFAESLLDAMGQDGVIFAYNAGFERNRIQELAFHFEDLATELKALLPRLVDLFLLARQHYYHPAMCGSWSFKSVFGALAPELKLDHFECPGVADAQSAFAESLQKQTTDQRRQVLRQALLHHAQDETEALRRMVTLFEQAGPASPDA